MIFSLLLIAGLCYTLVEKSESLQKANVIGIITVTILFFIIILFSVANFNLLGKYSLNKILNPAQKNFHRILLFFYCITALLFTAIYFYGIYDTTKSFLRGYNDDTGVDILIGMTFFLFCIFYSLVQSLKLKKLIEINARLKELENGLDEKDVLSNIFIEL